LQGFSKLKQLKNQDKMRKTYIIGLIAIVATLFASCNTKEVATKTAQVPEQIVKKDSVKQNSPHVTVLDSIYQQTEISLKKFISEHGDPKFSDVWWDSKKGEDQPFKRIRICPIAGTALIIERRPFPFTDKGEVLGYSVTKEKTNTSCKYVVEASRFVRNKQVESHKEEISTPGEMLKAVEIFQQRLQEARLNVTAVEANSHENEANIKKLSKNG
jgi:hypothetical protein